MKNLMQKLNQKRYLYLLFLLVSVLIVVFVNWHPGLAFGSGDYRYHINRIEALATAITHGNLLPKVDQYFAGGFGYASSLFYPDIFLYPAALLRVVGLPVVWTFLFTQIYINFLTLSVSYFAGKRMHFSVKNALIFSLIYFFSSYRLQVLFTRQDMGELMGMIFFPLVLSELLKFRKGEIEQWYILAVAMICVGFSHIISLFMMICFAIIFVILNLKYFWKKDTFFAILKAALLTIGVTFSLYGPIFEQMADQDFTVSTHPLIRIYQQIQPLHDLLVNSFNNQVFHGTTVNLGLIIILFLFIYTVYNLLNRKNLTLTIIAWLLLISCSEFFPWYALRHSIFASFQFPWRFFSLISLIVAYFIAKDDLQILQLRYFTPILLTLTLLVSFSLSQASLKAAPTKLHTYDAYEHISSYLIGAGHEYLPSAVDYNAVKADKQRKLLYDHQELSASHQEITKSIVKFSFNTKKTFQKVSLPLFYYKGYQAKLTGKGTTTQPELGDKGRATITLRGRGTVTIQYHYTTIQKFSLAVTGVSLLYSIFLIWRRRQIMP